MTQKQTTGTRKAVIYCRVSDEEQVKKGHGLKSQEAVCREFARYRGYDVIDVFHENISGKYSSRPVMTELLSYLRKHIRADFPLRGMVCCSECSKPLTSCWSTSKTGVKHPYYWCFNKECSQNRKSIRRDKLEGEFEAMLARVTPNQSLVEVAHQMFKDAWDQRVSQAQSFAASCKREAAQIEKQIEKLLDRVVEAGTDSVVRAYEKRIAGLERQALVLREKSENAVQRKEPFDALFELAMRFLANPRNLWSSGKMEYRNLVLRLTFADRLRYSAKSGFRTPKTTFPFNILSEFRTAFEQVADRTRFELAIRL